MAVCQLTTLRNKSALQTALDVWVKLLMQLLLTTFILMYFKFQNVYLWWESKVALRTLQLGFPHLIKECKATERQAHRLS